jgi:uncharacterized membrane protein
MGIVQGTERRRARFHRHAARSGWRGERDAMTIHAWLEPVARLLEIAGVAAILIATLLATAAFARDLRGSKATIAYERYRANLGRGILLGLEFLVGSDIIATVTAPLTWESVGLLGAIVLIRTLLSFSLETEIEGVAPWRRREVERDAAERR